MKSPLRFLKEKKTQQAFSSKTRNNLFSHNVLLSPCVQIFLSIPFSKQAILYNLSLLILYFHGCFISDDKTALSFIILGTVFWLKRIKADLALNCKEKHFHFLYLEIKASQLNLMIIVLHLEDKKVTNTTKKIQLC